MLNEADLEVRRIASEAQLLNAREGVGMVAHTIFFTLSFLIDFFSSLSAIFFPFKESY